MSKGAAVELGVIGILFTSAIACTLSSLSKQPYSLVEVRFCPVSANGFHSREQRKLDEQYCSIPRFILKEKWNMRGLFGSRIPERSDIKFKRLLPSDNPNQHIALTGTALCLVGISIAIAVRNSQLQTKYYSWLEVLKTVGFTTWTQYKQERELTAFNQQLNTQLKADVAAAMDNQTRVEAGLTDTESLRKQQQKQEVLGDTQYELMLAEFRKKIAEEYLGEAKADKEKQKLWGSKESARADKSTSNELELDEQYQWIYKLLKLPFRVLSGEQGSGKSTLERLMIRLLKDDGWYIVIVNPETNPAVWSGVQVLADADEINSFFEAFPQTIRTRQKQARELKIDEDDYLDYIKDKSGLEGKVAVFLMESNTYEVHGVDASLWANFLKQSLTNIRKWGYTVCLTAHSDNQTSISTKLQGFSKLIDSAPRVDCIAKAGENGEAVSSGKALLKMKGVSDREPDEVSLYNYPKSKKF